VNGGWSTIPGRLLLVPASGRGSTSGRAAGLPSARCYACHLLLQAPHLADGPNKHFAAGGGRAGGGTAGLAGGSACHRTASCATKRRAGRLAPACARTFAQLGPYLHDSLFSTTHCCTPHCPASLPQTHTPCLRSPLPCNLHMQFSFFTHRHLHLSGRDRYPHLGRGRSTPEEGGQLLLHAPLCCGTCRGRKGQLPIPIPPSIHTSFTYTSLPTLHTCTFCAVGGIYAHCRGCGDAAPVAGEKTAACSQRQTGGGRLAPPPPPFVPDAWHGTLALSRHSPGMHALPDRAVTHYYLRCLRVPALHGVPPRWLPEQQTLPTYLAPRLRCMPV